MPPIPRKQPKPKLNVKTLELLQKLRKVDIDNNDSNTEIDCMRVVIVCIACGGTKVNSKGGACYPCSVRPLGEC